MILIIPKLSYSAYFTVYKLLQIIMEQSTRATSRKKIIIWGAAILSSVTFLRFFGGSKKKKNETVKMLTQDGRLVEIDKKLLASSGTKITNEELQQWIKK